MAELIRDQINVQYSHEMSVAGVFFSCHFNKTMRNGGVHFATVAAVITRHCSSADVWVTREDRYAPRGDRWVQNVSQTTVEFEVRLGILLGRVGDLRAANDARGD